MILKNLRLTLAKTAFFIFGLLLFAVACSAEGEENNNILMRQDDYSDEYFSRFSIEEIEYAPFNNPNNIFGSEYSPDSILSVTFLDTLNDMPAEAWDASENQDGSVMAWVESAGSDLYDLYLAGEGGVSANPDSRALFYDYSNVESINFNDCFYTGNVTDMSYMFANCSSLTSLDISGFDTSNVADMKFMFKDCIYLDYLDTNGWDTSLVTDMQLMFNACRALTSVEVGGWDTSSVTNMNGIFDGCNSLQSLDVSNWDTSSVTDMSDMFCECSSLSSLDVSNWDTSNVTDMFNMFCCQEYSMLENLDVSGWDTSNVTDMSLLFGNCAYLTSLDIGGWDTSNVTEMGSVFMNCSSLKALDIGGWDISNVRDISSMFAWCSGLETLDISGWDTSNVTDMSCLFLECSSLKTLDLNRWKTSNVTNMMWEFGECSSLISLGINEWDTSNVTVMRGMFRSCSSLESLDLSGWDVSGCGDMTIMFSDCPNLKLLDLENWVISNRCDTTDMFSGSPDLSMVNTGLTAEKSENNSNTADAQEDTTDITNVQEEASRNDALMIIGEEDHENEEERGSSVTEGEAAEAYQEILDEYVTASNLEFEYPDDWTGVYLKEYPELSEDVMLMYFRSGGYSLYYTYYDIDGNGQDELIIGYTYEDETEFMNIADVYTFDGEKAVEFTNDISMGERVYLTIYENGAMIIHGSGGAASGQYIFLKIGDDGYTVNEDKTFTYDWPNYYEDNEQISTAEFDDFFYEYIGENMEAGEEEYSSVDDASTQITNFNWTKFVDSYGD